MNKIGLLYAYATLVETSEGTETTWRPRHRCEYNIKIDVKEIISESMGYAHLARSSGGLL
jgi:hypothetical protein